MVTIKSTAEIEKMRAVGKLAAQCLETLIPLVKPGVTGLEIDKFCTEWTRSKNAVPAPLNYKGFPKSLCISPNEVVCHGIPDKRPFKNGDIVNLDVTPKLEGYHGDTNYTVMIGNVAPEVRQLVEITYKCLWAGILEVRPGAALGNIGYAIQTLAEAAGYTVVVEYCGHGIGRIFHEDPTVSHIGKLGHGMKLKPGMTFTIEPMINLGKRDVFVEDDDWTVRTIDGKWSAQFEHTLLVTETGFEVLTLRSNEIVPATADQAKLIF